MAVGGALGAHHVHGDVVHRRRPEDHLPPHALVGQAVAGVLCPHPGWYQLWNNPQLCGRRDCPSVYSVSGQ